MQPPGTPMTAEAALYSGIAGRNVLLICTRDPRGRLNGRKTVLRAIIDSLNALDLRLTIAYFGPPEASDDQTDVSTPQYVALSYPTMAERLVSGVSWLLTAQPSLNEALYRSRRAEEALTHMVRENSCDIVITDMLRTAQYAPRLQLPWVADLDDLLSRRYRLLAASHSRQTNLLGYYQSVVGQVVLSFGRFGLPWVLRREAAEIERREIEVAVSADVTTLVSASEAAILTQASGRQVRCTPMSVRGPLKVKPVSERLQELVFLGGLDYEPNLRCVLQFDSEIRPALEARGITDLKLHVIGQDGGAGHSLSEAVVLEGYVENLDAAMQRFRAMLVPEVPPGGIKTKIIVAAVNGSVVLAHHTALDGMNLQSGREVWAWSSVSDLGDLLHRLRGGELDMEGMAQAARAWAIREYSPATLRKLWHQNISDAMRSSNFGGDFLRSER